MQRSSPSFASCHCIDTEVVCPLVVVSSNQLPVDSLLRFGRFGKRSTALSYSHRGGVDMALCVLFLPGAMVAPW